MTKHKYLLGIDFGGGASKATLLADDGTVAASYTVEYPTLYPKEGYAEQNPEDWYRATKENICGILKKSGIDPTDIIAVSLDAATHTAVLCDENFNVIRPAIYWTDTRSVGEVAYLKENYGKYIAEKVMHAPDTIWSLPELLWVKNNEPKEWARVRKILFAKDYVRHRLTGDYVTDFIEAEGSMLFDYNTLSWDSMLLGILGIDAKMMPEIVSPLDIAGKVTAEAAADTGLAEGTQVLCGATDTVMEVFAAGGASVGKMTLKLATAGRICVVTDKIYQDPNLINYSHFEKGLWYPGTATKSCAASYRWYRDTFGGDYRDLDSDAAKIEIGCGGLMFHPYLNGELTPYADPSLCASFIGVRAGHTKAHFTRAVLEGVALSMLDCMTALDGIGIPHDETATIIGGGGKSPLWRGIVSDCLGITLVQKKHSDSSFGSAMLAGIATGVFSDAAQALEICNAEVSRTEPNMENRAKYAELFKTYKRVHDALQPIYSNRG